MPGLLRLAFVIVLFALVTVPLLPFPDVCVEAGAVLAQSTAALVAKIHVQAVRLSHATNHGKMATGRPLLIVSNHVSWSDILVLGCIDKFRSLPKPNGRMAAVRLVCQIAAHDLH